MMAPVMSVFVCPSGKLVTDEKPCTSFSKSLGMRRRQTKEFTSKPTELILEGWPFGNKW